MVTFTPNARTVYSDYVSAGIPSSGLKEPKKSEIRTLLTAYESAISAVSAGLTQQGGWDASSGSFPGAGSTAKGDAWFVTTAGTVDGQKFAVGDQIVAIAVNASTSTYAANWATLPVNRGVVQGVDVGAGTANAIQVTTESGVSDGALLGFTLFEDTTAAATVSVDGSAPFAIKTNRGSDATALTENMFVIGQWRTADSELRLLNDQDVSALVAQAEAAAETAIAASNFNLSYPTKAALNSATVPDSATSVFTKGDTVEGDGGGGLWVDYDNGNESTTSNSGAKTWYLAPDVSRLRLAPLARQYIIPQDFLSTAGSAFSVDAKDAIQFAIDKAYSSGKDVFLPRGDYGVSAAIVLKSGVSIRSDGAVLKSTVANQGMFRNFVAGGAYSGRTAAGNFTVRGVYFDGDAVALGSDASMFNLCQAEQITFEDCQFNDVQGGHVFDLAGMRDVAFRRCSFSSYNPLGSAGTGDAFKEVVQIDICSSAGFPYGLDASSYDDAPCDGVTFEDVSFVDTGRPIGSHGWSLTGYADYWHTRINIDGMIVRGCSHDAIGAQRWKNFHWNGIDCDGSSGSSICFLRIDDCTDFLVENCRGVGSFNGRGIFVNRSDNTPTIENWSVVSCVVDGVSSGAGFDAFKAQDGTFVRPVSRNISGTHGVSLNTCVRVNCLDGVVENVNSGIGVGMRVTGSDRCGFKGGHIAGTYSIGASVTGGNDCEIQGVAVEGLASGKIGAQIGSSAVRSVIRECKLSGTNGTGVEITGSVTGGWADSNDFRGMNGGTKLTLGGSGPISTNNQT